MRTFSNAVPMGCGYKQACPKLQFVYSKAECHLPALEKVSNTVSLLFYFKLRKSSKGNQLISICLTQTKQMIYRNDQIDPNIDRIDTSIGIGMRLILP